MLMKNNECVKRNDELFQKYISGDLKAREDLIIHNMSLVKYIVSHNFQDNSVYDEMDDFISIGTIGLIKAIDTFDITKNVRFSTYASRVIMNEILMYLRKWKKYNHHLSLNQMIHHEDSEKEITLADVITDQDNFVDNIIFQLEAQEMLALLSNLNNKEQEILKYYFGFYPPKLNQFEIAQKFHLSQSYVSRIIRKSILKLQESVMINQTRKKSHN